MQREAHLLDSARRGGKRHANLATTQKHYHKLTLDSVAEGLASLPVVAPRPLIAATGTENSDISSRTKQHEARVGQQRGPH
jgi:hypothetical protein